MLTIFWTVGILRKNDTPLQAGSLSRFPAAEFIPEFCIDLSSTARTQYWIYRILAQLAQSARFIPGRSIVRIYDMRPMI